MPRKSLTQCQLDEIKKLVDDHDKILVRGNGKPSLQEDVRTLTENWNEFKESWMYWTRAIGAILLAQFISALIVGIVLIVRLAPLVDKIAQLSRAP